jgi:hypothetical protein
LISEWIRRQAGAIAAKNLGGFLRELFVDCVGGCVEAADCGAVENFAVGRKARAVARTIPAWFQGVPGDDAAEVSANGGQLVKLVRGIAVDSDFAEVLCE